MVKIEIIHDMRNELNAYKEKLLDAITNDKIMPSINTDIILKKYIALATSDLKRTMPLVTAKRLAKNILTKNMEDILNEG